MRPMRLLLLVVLTFTSAVLAGLPNSSAHAQGKGTGMVINGVRDTGQFLPDTTWILQVGPRVSTIHDFIERFFNSYGEDRPNVDSLGRIQFLNSMIDRDVLGMTALALNPRIGFEDRIQLRVLEQRLLANIVFQRLVLDSITVTDAEVRAMGQQYSYDQRFRHIVMDNRATAERVRRDLISGRLRWSDAVKRYSTGVTLDPGPDGDLGWVKRSTLSHQAGIRLFSLKPGELSTVFRDNEGFQIVQALERRPCPPIVTQAFESQFRSELQQFKSAEKADAIQQLLRDQISIVYDSTNIAWAAKQFPKPMTFDKTNGKNDVNIDAAVPVFTPTDTARTLATWKDGGRLSLSTLVHTYTEVNPMLRPNLSNFEAMRGQVDNIVLEPYMADYARLRGLDKDSLVVAEMAKRRERIAVERMYQDSVGSKVWVTRDERREFYEKHKSQYVTYASVDYAAIIRMSKKSADSLATALQKGARAVDILHADSLAGFSSGSIKHRSEDEKGQYFKVLFEELRPGQTAVFGPDKEGTYLVLQLITFNAGRQLSFEESDAMADESMQNIKAEQALRAMIDRLRKRYTIRSRPELVMRIKLVDPLAN